MKKEKNGHITPETVSPTQLLKDALAERRIAFTGGEDLRPAINSLAENKADFAFMDKFYRAFKLIMQLRNSDSVSGRDSIDSPILGKNGACFMSEVADKTVFPTDADGNGAYHIALKGLLLLRRLAEANTSKLNMKISTAEWLEFAQQIASKKKGE